MPHALVVENDPLTRAALGELLAKEGFTSAVASTLADARLALKKQVPEALLVSLKLPDGSGMELLKDLSPHPLPIELLVINEFASIESPIEALRVGLSDFVAKPLDVGRLEKVLSRVARTCELRSEIERQRGHFGFMWGDSPAMHEIYHLISRVAPTDAPVFLTGESGTGKEVAARTVHAMSGRRTEVFVPLNCGAIAENLIESELFGHERGSFTGADRLHKGHFEQARGGTLFLDEIGEMPPALQVKLLRVLESDSMMRLGGDHAIKVDVRVIAATNLDPEKAVEAGKIREDLLYRLMVFPINLPPLRDRGEDVVLLAQLALDQLNKGTAKPKQLSPAALERIRAKYWPGNVRQLNNFIQRAFILAESAVIGPECFPSDIGGAAAESPPPSNSQFQQSGSALTFKLGLRMDEIERRVILSTLDLVSGSRKKAAEILGISPKTLYNRLVEYQKT